MHTRTLIIIPTYQELKERPKTSADTVWVIFIVVFLFSLYILREFASVKIATLKEEAKAELEEKKTQLLRLESSYTYLQNQNQELININNRLLNQIALAKRIYDIDSDFFEKKEKPENATKESIGSSS